MPSIWVVVAGEEYVPEAFDTHDEAYKFAANEDNDFVSGPWEIAVGKPPVEPDSTPADPVVHLPAWPSITVGRCGAANVVTGERYRVTCSACLAAAGIYLTNRQAPDPTPAEPCERFDNFLGDWEEM